MGIPPRQPGYRRYYGYYNRPIGGCGCLYSILLVVLLYGLLSLIIAPLAIW